MREKKIKQRQAGILLVLLPITAAIISKVIVCWPEIAIALLLFAGAAGSTALGASLIIKSQSNRGSD